MPWPGRGRPPGRSSAAGPPPPRCRRRCPAGTSGCGWTIELPQGQQQLEGDAQPPAAQGALEEQRRWLAFAPVGAQRRWRGLGHETLLSVCSAPELLSSRLLRQLLDGAAAQCRLGLARDWVAAAIRALVVHLHQQPALALALADPGQGVAPVELASLQPDSGMATLQRPLDRLVAERPVAAGVPHDHGAGAVLALWDHALEAGVIERVVLDRHGQPLLARVGRRTLRDRPRPEHPACLEPEVIVQA